MNKKITLFDKIFIWIVVIVVSIFCSPYLLYRYIWYVWLPGADGRRKKEAVYETIKKMKSLKG